MKPIFAVLSALALLLAGCQGYPFAPANPPPPPTCEELAQQEESPENLPFETIARESYYHYGSERSWQSKEPGLLLLTDLAGIAQVERYINEAVLPTLESVDFTSFLVAIVFSGVKGGGAWQFCIISVTQQGQTVTLHVHLIDSPVHPSEIASYYHLVQLQKESLPTGEVTFQLALTRHDYVNPTGRQRVLETSQEEIVASITRSLP